jgi:NitT/TauT family transport system substrate-binding protein
MKNPSIRQLLATALAIGTSVGAAAQTGSGETLRIHSYPGGSNMHAVVAVAKGFCEKRNFKCEIKNVASAPLASQALMGKSIDVVNTSIDLVVTNVAAGADLVVVAMDIPDQIFAVTHRADLEVPNQAAGYPAMVKDWKGKRIGVGARGGASEVIFTLMLKDAGMSPSDVTYVGVGGPAGHYSAMLNKQIDVSVTFPPIAQLCAHMKGCTLALDIAKGQGPAALKSMSGANFPYIMRREMVDANPKLVKAYVDATLEADTWMRDPRNFAELETMYETLLDFGPNVPDQKTLRRTILTDALSRRTNALKTNRAAIQPSIDFAVANKLSTGQVDAKRLVWDQAP